VLSILERICGTTPQNTPANWFFSLAKPSRPTCAYLHVTSQDCLQELAEKVQQSIFVDAKNTGNDPALVDKPILVFAPNQRVPDSRTRNDARQGTIDQDPDFQAFLQNLTATVQRPATVDAEAPAKKEVVKTTPLIEAIREKKAAKERPTGKASSKHGKHELKESKTSNSASDKSEKKGGSKTAGKEISSTPEKGKRLSKADRIAKDAVKVLNREAGKGTSGASAGERRERVAKPISVAAIIQRDLGRAPAGGRRAKQESAAAETSNSQAAPDTPDAPATAINAKSSAAPPKDPKGPRNRRASKSATTGDKSTTDPPPDMPKKAPTGPAQPTILKKPSTTTQTPKGPAAGGVPRAPPVGPKASNIPAAPASATSPATSMPNTPTTPSSVGRQAFLKHANPSQGITEPLIEEALKVFGTIEKVEIDRKKGFAYVDFADADGLRKAVAASPIKVAQGAVQVLERRDRAVPRAPNTPIGPRGGFRGGRGGRGRGIGRGGGAPASPALAKDSTPVAAPGGSATWTPLL
jgi:regulator of nonsense transcripts 3